MPLDRWSAKLRHAKIPAAVSYHAGTFLCNAIMYLTHYWYQSRDPHKRIGFVHLPLATEQVAGKGRSLPSLPVSTLSSAIRLLLEDLATADSMEHVA